MELLHGAFVITMNPTRDVYTDGALAFDGDRIVEVGQSAAMKEKYPDAKRTDARGKAVIPGLIAAHAHLFQSLYRSLGTDRPLAEWLDQCIWPLSEALGQEQCRLAALLAAGEMMKTGTTTFVDSHYVNKDKFCLDGIAESIEQIGMRGSLCRSCVDGSSLAPHFRETPDEAKREAARVIKAYHGAADGRIRVRVEPLNEQLASRNLVRAMYEVSQEYGVGMSMHLAETAIRAAWTREKYGCSPLEYLSDLGVLGPHLLLAHCVWITEKDIELLRATDTRVAYNAISNQYLGDGVAPVPEMVKRGVCVAIAPDGAATNNNLDMFEVMKSAILMQRINRLEITNLNAEKALEMATIDGARAIGMEDEIGSLEPGKKADFAVVDVMRLEMAPDLGMIPNLVYSASGHVVESVAIDGKWVVRDHKLLTVDEEKIVADTNATVTDMVRKTGVKPEIYRSTWNYL